MGDVWTYLGLFWNRYPPILFYLWRFGQLGAGSRAQAKMGEVCRFSGFVTLICQWGWGGSSIICHCGILALIHSTHVLDYASRPSL